MTWVMHGRQYTWAQRVMTGSLTESRQTEHSSSEPLDNTTRSFSIKRSRISAGVADVPESVFWKLLSGNRRCSETDYIKKSKREDY